MCQMRMGDAYPCMRIAHIMFSSCATLAFRGILDLRIMNYYIRSFMGYVVELIGLEIYLSFCWM